MGTFASSLMSMLVGNGMAALCGGIATILAVRSLDPSDWAVAAVIIGVGPALGLVLSLGSVNYTIRELARLSNTTAQKERASLFFLRRLVVGIPVVCVGIISLVLGYWVFGYVLVLAGVRLIRGGSSVLMSARRKFRSISALITAEKATYLILVVGFYVADGVSIHTIAVSYLTSLLVYTGMALWRDNLHFQFRQFLLALSSPCRFWQGSRNFGIVSLLGPLQQIDVLIVAAVSGADQAGYFAAGSRIASGLNVAGAALSTVALPHFSGGARLTRLRDLSLRFKTAFVVGLLLVGALVATTGIWVPVLLGEQYVPAIPAIAVYLSAVIGQTAVHPQIAILQAWGDDRKAMHLALAQSVIGLCGILVGATIGGATGAATAYLFVVTAAVTVLSCRLRYVQAKMRENENEL